MPRHEAARCTFHIVGGQWLGKTLPHLLAARTPVHKDGGRDHDAPLEHIVLCDTGFNRSWNWCTRRCEVIRTGDRDYADQIRVIQVDENPNAWCENICTFFVAEYIKSKMTRECDLGQVKFHPQRVRKCRYPVRGIATPTEDPTCCVRNIFKTRHGRER